MKLYYSSGLTVANHLSIHLQNPLSLLFADLQCAPVPVMREPKATTFVLHSVWFSLITDATTTRSEDSQGRGGGERRYKFFWEYGQTSRPLAWGLALSWDAGRCGRVC